MLDLLRLRWNGLRLWLFNNFEAPKDLKAAHRQATGALEPDQLRLITDQHDDDPRLCAHALRAALYAKPEFPNEDSAFVRHLQEMPAPRRRLVLREWAGLLMQRPLLAGGLLFGRKTANGAAAERVLLARFVVDDREIELSPEANGLVARAPALRPHLRAMLVSLRSAKRHRAARDLAELFAEQEPLLAAQYDLLYALHDAPQNNRVNAADNCLASARRSGEGALVRELSGIAFEQHLRWSDIKTLAEFYDQNADALSLGTVTSTNLAAAYGRRLLIEGDAEASLTALDQIEASAADAFRPLFRLRSLECRHAALNAREGDAPRHQAAAKAFAGDVEEPFNKALCELSLSLTHRTPKATRAFLEVRVSASTREEFLEALTDAVTEARPLSAIRIGDGESYGWPVEMLRETPAAIAEPAAGWADQLKNADHKQRELNWWGAPIPAADKARFATDFRAAIAAADILGAPTPWRLARDARPDRPLYETLPGRGLAHVLAALDQTTLAPNCSLADERFNHLFDTAAARRISAPARKVIAIGPYGRSRFARFSERIGRDVEVFQIPPHMRVASALDADEHVSGILPDHYDALRERLADATEPGTLVWIAGGFLGKAFAHTVREAGGVAIDAGAAVDYWFDVKSRSLLDRAI